MEESSEVNTDFSSSSLKRRRDGSWSSARVGSSSNVNSGNNGFHMFVPPQQQSQQQDHQLHQIQQQQQQKKLSQTRLSSRNASFSRKSSGHLDMTSPTSSDNLSSAVSLSNLTPTIPRNGSFSPMADTTTPQIQRIIPAQGSVRGGIEVTLLGSGFYNGLVTKFGDVSAMATQCWSDSTIVAHLPPATMPGPVVVTFEGIARVQPQVFTYIDDTDSQLIELALQVVGLKMNGKLEDAKNIAMRIVGSSNNNNSDTGINGGSSLNSSTMNSNAVDHEKIILRCIDLIKMNTGKIPDWQLRNSEGQTMMHLAASLGFYKVVSSLISQGARTDLHDVNGMTPLHFAALRGRRSIVRKLIRCRADPFIRAINGQTVIDMADDSVSDELPIGLTHRQYAQFNHNRRTSSTSTFASFRSNTNARYSNLSRHASNSSMALYGGSDYGHNEQTEDDRRDLDEEFEDDDDSSEYDDGDLRMGDVRQALLRHHRRTSSVSSHTQNKDDDDAKSVDDSSTIVNEHHNREFWNNPRHRLNNTAENISLYLQQLTESARNKMVPWDRPNWDEIVNYIYRRPASTRPPRSAPRREYNSATSDSDATVFNNSNTRPKNSSNDQQKNLLRVWQFLTQSAEQSRRHQEQQEGQNQAGVSNSTNPTMVGPAPPPSYDEIFPETTTTPSNQANGGLGDTASDEKASQAGEEDEIEAVALPVNEMSDDYEQQFIKTWVNNKKKLQNDRRLFFFWIPVLVIAVSLVILRLSGATPEVYNSLLWTNKFTNNAGLRSQRNMPSLGRPLPASLASPTAFLHPKSEEPLVERKLLQAKAPQSCVSDVYDDDHCHRELFI
ncbi:Spt23p [Sugiyamaella lignohabitans]|uniref:Spt23p n=1 Tax=Sugiyamaella lignohabitans TaxID=796027 RepID=A0A167DN60_9ASCO|nr:Spt23p [Sugiyamaella lignohabitans]ANB13094.1 Spt23p [Sugiyamaella lignohabitans]